MKQILLLTAFLCSATVYSQLLPIDSIRIAELNQQLKSASGKKEVDLLNDLAWEYMWVKNDTTSAINFTIQAKKKAELLNYEKGLGFAYYNLSKFNHRLKNKVAGDSLRQISLTIAEKLNDSQLLGWLYLEKWELKKAYEHFRKAGDLDGEAEVATWLCDAYSGGNDVENGFSYCQRAIELADQKKHRNVSYRWWLSGYTYGIMAGMYKNIGDYQTALDMIKKGEKYDALGKKNSFWDYGSLYYEMGKFDSSVFYYEKALNIEPSNHHLMRYVGYANLQLGKYRRAIELLEKASKLFLQTELAKKGSPRNWRGEINTRLAEAYNSVGKRKEALNKYKFALKHSRIFYAKMQVTPQPNQLFYGYDNDRKSTIMNVSQDLAKIFHALGQNDSAYHYLKHYAQLKDTVEKKKRTWQLNMQLSNYKRAAEEEKRSSQLQLLKKDNQLSQAKLKQETTLKNSLAMGFLLFLLAGIFIFRSLHLKRKNEKLRRMQLENELKVKELESIKKHSELQQKATELEMQALRAQMNPHFIFNCLSSINRFILKNETEAASDYLTRFSRLIRMVLINSQKTMIPLEDEMEMLRLYLDMERLRFKNSFDYNIIYSNTVDAGNTFIPPLLLQPFCENAIWHGLMHKDGQGKLDISIRMERNTLHCTISDNGIGRKKAAELKSKSGEKSKSLGLKITTDRLALLNENRDIETFYHMHDLVDENGEVIGTKVEIQIKNKEEIRELVP